MLAFTMHDSRKDREGVFDGAAIRVAVCRRDVPALVLLVEQNSAMFCLLFWSAAALHQTSINIEVVIVIVVVAGLGPTSVADR